MKGPKAAISAMRRLIVLLREEPSHACIRTERGRSGQPGAPAGPLELRLRGVDLITHCDDQRIGIRVPGDVSRARALNDLTGGIGYRHAALQVPV